MPRRPPRPLVVASAVLPAAVVALWVWSYWRYDELCHVGSSGELGGMMSFRGTLVLLRHRSQPVPITGTRGWRYIGARTASVTQAPGDHFRGRGGWYWMGFGYERRYAGVGSVGIPCWFLTLVAAAPLAWAALARRRPPPGHCRSCGYDLTANVSGRCPECGRAVTHVAEGLRP